MNNHNPFDDLMKISSANAGIQHQASAPQEEEAPNPYFVQGMDEEFDKIAKEMAPDYVNREGGKKTGALIGKSKVVPYEKNKARRGAAYTKQQNKVPVKGSSKSDPVKKARLKAKEVPVPKDEWRSRGTSGKIKGLGSTVSGDRRGAFGR